jgi:ParB-like chromosome segregation protein Spo0J
MTIQALHDLAVERVPVAELRTYHRNPRIGDVDAIRRSLTVNGQYRPIVANRGTHTGRPSEVLAGNHTLMAARDAGWADIAVCWVDVDGDQAARIVAADNRTADLGAYDEEILAALLGELPDLEGTGYTDDDLAKLLESRYHTGLSTGGRGGPPRRNHP